MHRDYSSVDPRVLNDVNKSVVAEAMEKYNQHIKNSIDVLREQGYSDDDILLILIEEKSHPKFNSVKNESSQKVKSKNFTYDSYFYNK